MTVEEVMEEKKEECEWKRGDECREKETFPSVCPVANLISLASPQDQIRLFCSGNTNNNRYTSTHTQLQTHALCYSTVQTCNALLHCSTM